MCNSSTCKKKQSYYDEASDSRRGSKCSLLTNSTLVVLSGCFKVINLHMCDCNVLFVCTVRDSYGIFVHRWWPYVKNWSQRLICGISHRRWGTAIMNIFILTRSHSLIVITVACITDSAVPSNVTEDWSLFRFMFLFYGPQLYCFWPRLSTH